MTAFFEQFMSVMPIVFVMFIAFVVLRAAYGQHVRLHGYSYNTSIKDGNSAASIRLAGIMLGSTFAFWGLIRPTELGIVHDLIMISQCLFLTIIFMVIAGYVNDKMILTHVDNLEAVFRSKNISVAMVEFGSFVATGLIFSASQTGGSTFLSSLSWFVGGQITLVVGVYMFAILRGARGVEEMHRCTMYDDRSYSFVLACYITSLGIVISVLVKNVERPGVMVAAFLSWFIVTIFLQYFTSKFTLYGEDINKMFGTRTKNDDIGIGVIQGTTFLTSALVIGVFN